MEPWFVRVLCFPHTHTHTSKCSSGWRSNFHMRATIMRPPSVWPQTYGSATTLRIHACFTLLFTLKYTWPIFFFLAVLTCVLSCPLYFNRSRRLVLFVSVVVVVVSVGSIDARLFVYAPYYQNLHVSSVESFTSIDCDIDLEIDSTHGCVCKL